MIRRARSGRQCGSRRRSRSTPANIPSDGYADFTREFTPKERIEVAIVAISMRMLNKLNDALRVPLESGFEALIA